jgi:hypothetical protein
MIENTQMTRYINLCRDTPKKEDTKPIPLEDPPTKYEKYRDNYELYRNLEHRKEFMKEYNKNYRLQHSNTIECECGIVYKDISKYAHKRSKRHTRYTENKNKVDT